MKRQAVAEDTRGKKKISKSCGQAIGRAFSLVYYVLKC